MGYSSLDDLKKKIDQKMILQLTDTTNSGSIDQITVTRAIRDADALINSYVSKVYQTPLSPVPNVIVDMSATLAISALYRFRSLESAVWSQAKERAEKFLASVATGSVTLEGAMVGPSASSSRADAPMVSTPDRIFSRSKLDGM